MDEWTAGWMDIEKSISVFFVEGMGDGSSIRPKGGLLKLKRNENWKKAAMSGGRPCVVIWNEQQQLGSGAGKTIRNVWLPFLMARLWMMLYCYFLFLKNYLKITINTATRVSFIFKFYLCSFFIIYSNLSLSVCASAHSSVLLSVCLSVYRCPCYVVFVVVLFSRIKVLHLFSVLCFWVN